jgi:tetratricopeptide (TPR) repeat protein
MKQVERTPMQPASSSANLFDVLHKRVDELIAAGRAEDALRIAHTATAAARHQLAGGLSSRHVLISSLLILADLKRVLDDPEGAESVYQEGLQLAASIPPEEEGATTSLDVAWLRAGLASLYDFSGREEEAVPLYTQAIATLETYGTREKLEAAFLHNNLAMIFNGVGEPAKAEAHYLAALAEFQDHFGSNATVATVLDNLGSLYLHMSRAAEAEAMHQRALAIRRAGERRIPQEPGTGQGHSLVNLASLLQLNDAPV